MSHLPTPKLGDRYDSIEVVKLYRPVSSRHLTMALQCAACQFVEVTQWRTFSKVLANSGWPNHTGKLCRCCDYVGHTRGTAKVIDIANIGSTLLKTTYKIEHLCCGAHENVTRDVLQKRSDSIRRGCRFCNNTLANIYERFSRVQLEGKELYIPLPKELQQLNHLRLGGQHGYMNPAWVSYVISRSGL